tara:strand:- start:236 stop:715 length:480 start_codon:yes stop_codon:yes gene_type:complete
MDTQQVEIIGRNLLVSACVADGLEVSQPLRDRGIDLIIFDDHARHGQFSALPVQLKASSSRSFSVHAKYAKFPNLLMAYTWHSDNPVDARLYIMTYGDALKIAEASGWLSTSSWVDGGGYSTQSPSKKLEAMLREHEYTPGKIKSLMDYLTAKQSSYRS